MANPKPVAEVRIGRVKAAIWQNETEEGHKRHNSIPVFRSEAAVQIGESATGTGHLKPDPAIVR